MRVIAGTSRGRRLMEFKGRNIRPTPDRVREALFSILQSKLGGLAGCAVLDLFAGSGALAIEALSRGAATACLVEKAPASARIIQENLARCQLTDRAKLITGDAWQVLRNLGAEPFDLVFIDPPYGQDLAVRALVEIDKQNMLSKAGILCAETGVGEQLPETVGRLHRVDQRRYGTIMLNFYSHAQEDPT